MALRTCLVILWALIGCRESRPAGTDSGIPDGFAADREGPPMRLRLEPGDVRVVGRYTTFEGSSVVLGEVITRYASSVHAVDPGTGASQQFVERYTHSTETFISIYPYTVDGQLYVVSDSSGGGPGVTVYDARLQPIDRGAGIIADGGFLGVAGDALYASFGNDLDGRGTFTWAASVIAPSSASMPEVPMEFDWRPTGLSIDAFYRCRPQAGAGAFYCAVPGTAGTVTELCADTCTDRICDGSFPCPVGPRDGICSDEMDLPECALGSDCADCGPRTVYEVCENTCGNANNGRCEQGAGGVCASGTDCADCGPYETQFEGLVPSDPSELRLVQIDPNTRRASVIHEESGERVVDGSLFPTPDAVYWLTTRGEVPSDRPLSDLEVTLRRLPTGATESEALFTFIASAPPEDLEGDFLLLSDFTLVNIGTGDVRRGTVPEPPRSGGFWQDLELFIVP
ncbi:MAG: hypothetical protein AAGF12_38270 [Myxococcota bacterium]